MTQVCIAITGSLSDDAHQQAAELQRLATAWATFVGTLKELPLEPRIVIAPTLAAKPVRRRRGRPRLVSEPSSAA